MPIPTFTGLRPDPTFEDLKIKINTLVKELTNLMLNLDKENIVEVDGDVIISGTVTANKMQVNELSAISANLGHITAGLIEAIEIYGSYIATAREGIYPRSEMSNTANMFRVASSPSRSISMDAWGGASSTPVQRFDSDNMTAVFYPLPNSLALITVGGQGNIEINSGQDLVLGALYDIQIPSWSKLKSLNTGGSLQDYLDWLDSRITALGG